VHKKWFNARFQDPECLLYVAENLVQEKVGQIRFELKNEGWIISISIVKEFRGKGLGSDLIKAGSLMLFDSDPEIDRIHAYIKNENLASVHVFEKSGYKKVGSQSINSKNDAVLMLLDRKNIL
jgi:UDP-2,4-diacetamido-2,4,6-trideoxy-beta-L-altropyranose hydrolase